MRRSCGLDQPGGLGEVLLGGHRVRRCRDRPAGVHRDDVGALLREADGVAATLAAGRAGDERKLAVEEPHAPHASAFLKPVPLRRGRDFMARSGPLVLVRPRLL